jgi:hypothetical protein
MNRTNTRDRYVSAKRRQLTGQLVDMALALFEHGADLDSNPSCRSALHRAGYPMRTINLTLNAALIIARKVRDEPEA